MNSGNMNDAMNSTEISGTPRISSTYSTHTARIAGSLEVRPSATRIASGKATARLTTANASVSGKPPQREVSTAVKPSTPPRISTKHTASTISHSGASHGFQNGRRQLATSSAIRIAQAASGRHCSSNG